MNISLHKILSKNDTGETGGHQDGFLVPKSEDALTFFPKLGEGTKNPRHMIVFRDAETGKPWTFSYIYYNNRMFGGTRNEYRLTRVAAYIRSKGLSAGDVVMLDRLGADYLISYYHKNTVLEIEGAIRLSGKKRVVFI
jgi:hypothetical protein